LAIRHVVGFDDFPFPRSHRGDVSVVGAVFSGVRLEGVLSGRVRRDGANATAVLARLVSDSRFAGHLQLVMLQGIALAGFNVVDLHGLHRRLDLPVLAVARRAPRLDAIRHALLSRVPGGARKWRLIERAGPMEELEGVFVQRVGLSTDEAREAIRATTLAGRIPEPLRTAHLIAGGIARGESRGRT
jgi:endonuclease V-like protein UPF0215 family